MKRYFNLKIIVCFLTCFIVFLFYLHTLNYEWKGYDENIIPQELLFPIPESFSEIFEYLTSFGLKHYFEAGNPLYSNITNLRSDPVNFFTYLFVLCIFKKNVFLYHLLSLLLHLINTCLLFMILDSVFSNFYSKKIQNNIGIFLASILSLFWALHPLNVEAVLLATNWPALLTYAIGLFIFLICLSCNHKRTNRSYLLVIFLLFLIALFNCEHLITLPIIIFSYLLAENNYYSNKLNLRKVFLNLFPLFLGITIFIIYFLFSPSKVNLYANSLTSSLLTFERIFWLSPQIFFHFIKLIILPAHLSIDQALFVHLSKLLLEPYTITCSLIMIVFVFGIISSALFSKKTPGFLFFIIFGPFFITLLPFLHIISPIYNLASERYLYFPLFFLTIGIGHLIYFLTTKANKTYKAVLLISICLITLSYSTRGYVRTFDWKNNFTLLQSSLEIAPNNLLKGYLQESLAMLYKSFSPSKAKIYHKIAIISLSKKLSELKKEALTKDQNIPETIKFYGLDPKTLESKVAFLIAQSRLEEGKDYNETYQIISPYINRVNISSSQVLKFFYNILFQTNRLDEAEQLLSTAMYKNQISPNIYIALSDLYEYKYNDLKETEKYLLLSHKYFPYDALTLFALQRLYKNLNNAEKYAWYSYLFGIRTHDAIALKDAAYIYLRLGNQNKSKQIINKLLKYYPVDEYTLKVKTLYEQSFGRIKS